MSWRKGLLLLFAIKVGSMDGLPLNICTSEVCKFEANRIKGNIDNSVAPCDNFYQFACGNYDPVISEEKLEVNACTEQKDLIDSQLYKLMSEKIMETDIHPIKLVKNFFQSCMDTETINKIGLKHVVEKMIQLGGWPVVKSHGWNESSWSYQNFIQFAELQGIIPNYYFFSLSVGQNPKNKTKMILKLEQAKLLLNRAFLIKGLNSSVMQAYHSYQIDLAVLYGADRNDAEKEMKDVLDFEITFAKIAQLEETYELVTVTELQMIFPSLRWLDYMNAFLPKDKQITENEEVKISSKIVFLNIHKLLSRTSKRVLANYVMWRIAFKTSPYMSDDIQQRLLKFLKNITDEKNDEPRWKLCESRTSYFLDLAYSAIYVRKYFNEKSKYDVMELVESIKEQFKSTIEATEWMDEKTKNKAIEKLLNMKNYTGYVDDLKDDKKLIEFYKDLDFNNKEFFKSYLKIIQFNRKKIFSLFRESVNETDLMLYSDVTEVNAFYAPTLNSILFPAGFLQGQIFSADRPKYMNYGSIGWVIGHEITHGFDNKGCQFNANGEKVNWWQNGTLNVYNKKIQCISYQYGNYTEPSTKLKLNGTKTLGENIADNGGILLSYKAYQKWIKESKEEPILPDLNFTSNQLFWISAAQTWCSKTRPETMKLIIATDTHSPPLFRVNGAFSNTLEFSNDFKCPESSAMNRKNKCKVW